MGVGPEDSETTAVTGAAATVDSAEIGMFSIGGVCVGEEGRELRFIFVVRL